MRPQFLKTALHFSLLCGICLGACTLMNKEAFANAQISAEKAKEIALSHAKITDKNVPFSDIELDSDFGKTTYEIEFFHNNTEYDYEIDANTGNVVAYKQKKQANNASQQDAVQKQITDVQAKEIAMKHANISANQVNHSQVKFDMEDGVPVYDVEFYVNKKKYEYEIHAITSEIIEFGQE